MEINAHNLTSLTTALNAAFSGALEQAASQYRDIATVTTSATATTEYPWLGKVPSLREWIGDRVIQGVKVHGYSIKNRKFELTESIPRDAIEDDSHGVYTPLFTEMGRATGSHPDELVFGLLKDGRTAESYDGVPFFSAAHPVDLASGKAGTQTNILDGAGGSGDWYVMDLSRAIRPLVLQNRRADEFVARVDVTDENVWKRDEFEWGVSNRRAAGFGLWQLAVVSNKALDAANLKAAVTALQTRKADLGRPLGLRATHLVVPAGKEFEALELLATQRNAAGADNVLNGRLKILASPWLD